MNKTLKLFAAALLTIISMGSPVFAAQSGDHIKQHDPIYWNPDLRGAGTVDRTNAADLGTETQKPESVRGFMPN